MQSYQFLKNDIFLLLIIKSNLLSIIIKFIVKKNSIYKSL